MNDAGEARTDLAAILNTGQNSPRWIAPHAAVRALSQGRARARGAVTLNYMGNMTENEAGDVEERIRSRLGWGLVVDIHQTDFELRFRII